MVPNSRSPVSGEIVLREEPRREDERVREISAGFADKLCGAPMLALSRERQRGGAIRDTVAAPALDEIHNEGDDENHARNGRDDLRGWGCVAHCPNSVAGAQPQGASKGTVSRQPENAVMGQGGPTPSRTLSTSTLKRPLAGLITDGSGCAREREGRGRAAACSVQAASAADLARQGNSLPRAPPRTSRERSTKLDVTYGTENFMQHWNCAGSTSLHPSVP